MINLSLTMKKLNSYSSGHVNTPEFLLTRVRVGSVDVFSAGEAFTI